MGLAATGFSLMPGFWAAARLAKARNSSPIIEARRPADHRIFRDSLSVREDFFSSQDRLRPAPSGAGLRVLRGQKKLNTEGTEILRALSVEVLKARRTRSRGITRRVSISPKESVGSRLIDHLERFHIVQRKYAGIPLPTSASTHTESDH